MSSVSDIKELFFKRSLTKLGSIIAKLDNKLGLKSEFGEKHSEKPNLVAQLQVKEQIPSVQTDIPKIAKIDINVEKTKENTDENKNSKEVKPKEKENKEKVKSSKEEKNNEVKEKKDDNKETKEPKKPNKKEKEPTNKTLESYKDVDLRVAKVEKIIEMEGSDNLYHCWVDVGEGSLREIGCGLRKFGVSKDEFTKDLIVVFANLKPKKLANIMSNGMIMSASKEEKFFELIRPQKGAKPGDSLYLDVEGSEAKKEIAEFLSSNKFTKVMPLLKSDNEKIACFGEFKLKTTSGYISVPTLANSHIS